MVRTFSKRFRKWRNLFKNSSQN